MAARAGRAAHHHRWPSHVRPTISLVARFPTAFALCPAAPQEAAPALRVTFTFSCFARSSSVPPRSPTPGFARREGVLSCPRSRERSDPSAQRLPRLESGKAEAAELVRHGTGLLRLASSEILPTRSDSPDALLGTSTSEIEQHDSSTPARQWISAYRTTRYKNRRSSCTSSTGSSVIVDHHGHGEPICRALTDLILLQRKFPSSFARSATAQSCLCPDPSMHASAPESKR